MASPMHCGASIVRTLIVLTALVLTGLTAYNSGFNSGYEKALAFDDECKQTVCACLE
jgi:hypothetical protein